MPLAILTTTAFVKDLRRARKQGKDLDKLEAIVTLLQDEQPLPARCRTPIGCAAVGQIIGTATSNRIGFFFTV